MRMTIVLLVALAGCAAASQKALPPSAAEREARLLESDLVDRLDVESPPGWYWLLTTQFGLIDAMGSMDPDFKIRDGRATPTRLGGVEGDSLREFDERPQGLDWVGGEALYMVEFETDVRSLNQRARFAEWEPPMMTGEEEVCLGQRAWYEADVTSVFINAGMYKDDDRTLVAWWGYRDRTSRKERSLIRCRYFDKTSPQWPAIQRAVERAGSRDDEEWSARAGAAAFEELGLRD